MVSWNISVLIVLILMKDEAQCLQYNFGDGSYYVGSVDNQGRPSGRGQYHNSSGDLGNFQTYYPFMLHYYFKCFRQFRTCYSRALMKEQLGT